MPELEKSRKSLASHFTQPASRILAKTPLSPNIVTWMGFAVTLVAAALIATEHLLAGGIVVIVAGLFDMLDGALARLTGRVTRFGGILDSTLDRLSEAALLLALLSVFAGNEQPAESVLTGVALVGSLVVSYVRARAEGAGIECKEGIFTRPERVVVLALGLMLSRFDHILVIALGIITFFSYFTVVERLVYAWRHTRE